MNPRLRRVAPAYVTLLLWSVASSASISGPVMPLYVESLGIGVVGWSGLVSSWALGMFLVEWVWGSLSDRIDRRRLMLLSVLSMSILSTLYTVQALLPFFIILQFVSGAMSVAIGPTTRAYVSDESPQRSIGLYASLWWVFIIMGWIIGPVFGTYVAQTWSFAYSFWLTSALSVLVAIFIFVSFPRGGNFQAAGKTDMVGGLRLVLGRRSAKFLFLAAIFSFMGRAFVSSFLPLYASQQIRMSTVDVGVLVACMSVAQLLATPVVGLLSDRFGRRITALLGFIISSGIFLLYFHAYTASLFLAVSVAAGLGLSVISLLLSMIPDVAPSTMHGTAVGIYGSFEDLGVICGPLLYGFVWSVFAPVYIFAAVSITQLVAALLVFQVRRRVDAQFLSG